MPRSPKTTACCPSSWTAEITRVSSYVLPRNSSRSSIGDEGRKIVLSVASLTPITGSDPWFNYAASSFNISRTPSTMPRLVALVQLLDQDPQLFLHRRQL